VMRQHNIWCVYVALYVGHSPTYNATKNKEPTSSLKMIRIMIEIFWSVFLVF